ncbi:MAG: hypothetical protein ACOH2G_02045 [Ewingella sp.]
MKLIFSLSGVLLLTGCSIFSTVSDYNKNLTDYSGDEKVGIAFNISDDQVRVYPETKSCIDLYSKNNGFVPRGLMSNGAFSNGKKIGMPEVEGINKKSQEYWISANDHIAVRVLYTGEKRRTNIWTPKVTVSESIISFKPQPGMFYYVTVDFDHQNVQTGKYLRVYQIENDSAGVKKLKHVDILKIDNCPGQQPWYTRGGAAI